MISLLLPAALSALLLGPPAHAEDALEQAYQREVAFLLAEKEALTRRRAEVSKERAERVRAAERELDGLQGRLLGLERRASQLEAELREREEARQAALDREELLRSTIAQAAEAASLEVAEATPPEDTLSSAFAWALPALSADRSLQVSPATFFLATGEAVEGEVVRLGRVAAWGVSPQGSGSLMPLGEGRFGLRAAGDGALSAPALAAAAAGGAPPPRAEAFVVEGFEAAMAERKETTLQDTLDAGGLVGYVILGLGIVAGALTAARALTLSLARRGAALGDTVAAAVLAGDLSGARAAVATAAGPTARVLRDLLTGAERTASGDRDALQDLAAESILRVQPPIVRFGAAILVIAAVAPLLGLLGTVTGMISTFDIITEYGTGDPKMLSGGISEALVTTEFGLIVAIPCVLLGNLTRSWADGVLGQIEQAALQVINAVALTAERASDERDGPDDDDDGDDPSALDAEERPSLHAVAAR
jgi:biopolymer transport protein ExbB